jgi:hypothetical protein
MEMFGSSMSSGLPVLFALGWAACAVRTTRTVVMGAEFDSLAAEGTAAVNEFFDLLDALGPHTNRHSTGQLAWMGC